MLVPQEIADKKYPKTVIWGYEMSEVDSFMDRVRDDYAALYKDNQELKSKLRILAKKVEEYRAMDESLRRTLADAHTQASRIVEDAEKKAADVEKASQERKAAMEREYAAEDLKLAGKIAESEKLLGDTRNDTQAFLRRLAAEYEAQAAALRDIDIREFGVPAAKSAIAEPPVVPENVSADDAEDVQMEELDDTASLPALDEPETQPAAEETSEETDPAEVQILEIPDDIELSAELEAPVKEASAQYSFRDDDDDMVMLTEKPKFDYEELTIESSGSEEKK